MDQSNGAKYYDILLIVCASLLAGQLIVATLVAATSTDHSRVSRKLGAAVDKAGFNSSSTIKLQPYRTGFHFQPAKNWMNDPNGPIFYKGWYHLFYQYNPDAAVWGNIVWAHAVSKDLVHWRYLDPALKGDHWYDIQGVWSGSATFLDDGTPVMLYTGWSNAFQQMQSIAVPKDPSDPLLREWVKDPRNPIAVAPAGYNSSEFRDPTTAWKGDDGVWRILVGANRGSGGSIGTALMFKSSDFATWNFSETPLHSVEKTGMWECPDFYPVHESQTLGLRPSAHGPHVKHVLKVSLDDKRHDYYSVRTYNTTTDTYEPEIPDMDTGLGLRYDYGKFYASKTFFDQNTDRRILWGWANESSSVQDDIDKGWSSVQCLPRHIWLDNKTTTNLIQWPIAEVEQLRDDGVSMTNMTLKAGSTLQLQGVGGAQLDIEVHFAMPIRSHGEEAPELFAEAAQLTCSQLVAAADTAQANVTGAHFGPFGLYVLATDDMAERTAIFFHLVHSRNPGGWKTLVCSDQSRSTPAQDVDKTTYGSYVHVAPADQALSLRVLVDHSIVESFAQGGRTVITSRVYPRFLAAATAQQHHHHHHHEESPSSASSSSAAAARILLFNNASRDVMVQSISAWRMKDINLGPLQLS